MQHVDPTLLSFLQTHELPFDYYEHIPVFTVEESASIKHQIPGAHTKNLFLTDKKGEFYLVSIEASKRLPVNQLRKHLGTKELSFWSAEQLYEILQLTPGSVSLFGLIHAGDRIHVLLDQDLRDTSHVGRHPNRNDATLVIDRDTLRRFLIITGYTPRLISFDHENVYAIQHC